MNVLVIADRIKPLVRNLTQIKDKIDSVQDSIFYFSSSLESGYDLPQVIRNNFVRESDYSGSQKERYEHFRVLTEQYYYKLCDRFNALYRPCLLGFNLYDLPQYDIGILLMEFVRVHNFLKFFIALKKINKIIILKPRNHKVDFSQDIYGYLYRFPVDTAIAEVIKQELAIPCVEIVVMTAPFRLSKYAILAKQYFKDFLRYLYFHWQKAHQLISVNKSKKNKDIIIFGALNHLLGVAKELGRAEKLNLLFYHPVPLVKFFKTLREHGIKQIYRPHSFIFGNLKLKFQINSIARQAKQEASKVKPANLYDFLCLVFNEYCKYYIPIFSSKLKHYLYLIKKIKPQAILMDENVSILRKPFELAAKKHKVAVYIVNHGVPAKGYPIFLEKSTADTSYQFIGGQYIKDTLTNYYQVNPARFIITGTPRYDDIYCLSGGQRHRNNFTVCLGPGFSLKRGTTYNYLDYVLNFKTNLKVILEKQKQYGFSLTVKFHPGDPHEDMVKNECLTAKVEAKYITNEMSAIEVLREADLVIVAWSTICLEAALLNKPIIIMNNNIGYCQPYDFVEDGLGIFAEDKYSLANLIDKFFKEALIPGLLPDSKKTIDLHKYEKFQDGGASRRAADFILQNIS